MDRKIVFYMILASLLFFSCNKEKDTKIILDDSEPFAIVPSVKWAVITESFVSLKEKPSWKSTVKNHSRKGEIFEVKGNCLTDNEMWFLLEDGWICQSSVSIHSNKYQANTFSKELISSFSKGK